MSSRSGHIKCSMKLVGECGNVRPATHGDTVEWCFSICNTGNYTLIVSVKSLASCMPEIDPATMAWVPTQTGGASGAASPAAGPILSNTLTMPPASCVEYLITAQVRDDAICPSWIVNSAELSFTGVAFGKKEVVCKPVVSDALPVGTDDVPWELYPCDPLSLNTDEHVWNFAGGGSEQEHAKLVQQLCEGITLSGVLSMLKELDPALYAKYADRKSKRPEDNLAWPQQQLLTATAVATSIFIGEGEPPGPLGGEIEGEAP